MQNNKSSVHGRKFVENEQSIRKHETWHADITCVEQLLAVFLHMQLAGSMNKIHFVAALLFSLKWLWYLKWEKVKLIAMINQYYKS